MERLAWQLLCFAPSTTDLPTKTSGDILTISISCRAAAWYLQFCSGRSCCRPQLQSAVSCFLQYSAATGSGGAAAENCIFYSATLVPAIILSRYLGQRCEASSQVSVFPSTLWFTSTSPHDLEVLFSANIRFHYKAFVDFDSIYFLQNKSRRSIDTPGSGYYSWEFLQKPILVTTNFCSPLFLFSSMLDVMWRFCGSFSACFYCFSKIGSRTEHGSYKKLHCEHKRTTTWGESFLVEVVTGSSVPNPWNKTFRFRHWCNNMIYTLVLVVCWLCYTYSVRVLSKLSPFIIYIYLFYYRQGAKLEQGMRRNIANIYIPQHQRRVL